ncbi:hypothetical protein [Sporosarcina ureilytica]|uniref:Citrate transporter-like domain-containing protein n=1 Tax=Sporosarcina ureilytica TaxID=298596 RepID=A0A1D8JIU1_9BACL|nr:hypothetical protein [Sporosarcina ureilytica]AOV08624.1 hypothetical protein BI350_14500 [Sporosarcina ureilytica]
MKGSPLFQYLYIFYTFVFTLHIANIFIEHETLNYMIGVFALIMLVVSFIGASRLFLILSVSFLTVGAYLFWTTGESVSVIPSIITSNLSLLTLLAMLPWMNSVVRSGRFDRSLNTLMRANVSDLGKLYTRGSGTTLTLAAFLNLSAVSISQEVLKRNLAPVDRKVRNAFISASTLRGFSLAVLWSPLEILVALPIFLTGVSYVSIFPWLLLVAVITFTLDSIWGRYYFKKYTYQATDVNEPEEVSTKGLGGKIFHLAGALVLFLALVIIGGTLFEIDFILTVTLLIFPFTLIWSVIMKRLRSFWAIGWNTWKEKTNTMQNFVILFISLSFFSYSISSAAFLDVIQKPILYVSEYPLLVFFVIQVLFIGLSMFGIHPVATLGILGSLISTLLTVYNPLSIAIVLVTSAIATLTVGTYGLVVTLTAMSLEQSPYRITLMNLAYAFIFGGIGTLIAYFLL